jgi:UDP-3-O-[3-hydroxymyristoyl] N-acetylglucosamine deacetylase
MSVQCTLARAVRVAGIGLHCGVPVSLDLQPAPADSGICFRRSDLADTAPVPARLEYVTDTRLRTTLARGGAIIATVEHLLAALAGLGIDNAVAVLDGPEVPALDGSAAPFVALIREGGIVAQQTPRRRLRVLREVRVSAGDAFGLLRPAPGLRVDFRVDYGCWPAVGEAAHAVFDAMRHDFTEGIAPARTFGFAPEIAAMRAAGLARGGSLDNAVVIEAGRVHNPGGLRFADELVRHKILDAIGDLYLLGRPLLGELVAFKAGHTLNVALLRALVANTDAWELVTDR